MVRLTDRPDMSLDGYRGRKTTQQHQQGPVVQSIISLTSSLRAHLVKCFYDFIAKYTDIIC